MGIITFVGMPSKRLQVTNRHVHCRPRKHLEETWLSAHERTIKHIMVQPMAMLLHPSYSRTITAPSYMCMLAFFKGIHPIFRAVWQQPLSLSAYQHSVQTGLKWTVFSFECHGFDIRCVNNDLFLFQKVKGKQMILINYYKSSCFISVTHVYKSLSCTNV